MHTGSPAADAAAGGSDSHTMTTRHRDQRRPVGGYNCTCMHKALGTKAGAAKHNRAQTAQAQGPTGSSGTARTARVHTAAQENLGAVYSPPTRMISCQVSGSVLISASRLAVGIALK